jgi:hypothetical protein
MRYLRRFFRQRRGFGILPYMLLRLSNVRLAIDPSAAKTLYNSICGTRLCMLHLSTVKLATLLSAATRLRSSTCGTPRLANVTETPLDVFFGSFPTFNYDPSLPPATSYAYLREHEGWQRRDATSSDARGRYQDVRRQTADVVWNRGRFDCVACPLSCHRY